MTKRAECEFQLIRYVPDPIRNEFINIGVLLRASDGERTALQFTRDWSRVRCLDPDADIPMLEALEMEIGQRLQGRPTAGKPIRTLLEESLSNNVQLTETKAFLAETFPAGLEDLLRIYIETPRRQRMQRRGGRASVLAAMRTRFEQAGVWAQMRKQIAASDYTRSGDPLRIDCGYRNGMVKMFQAVSVETDADDAKLLSFAAPRLRKGVEREEKAEFLLTAIIEPFPWPSGEGDPTVEQKLRYDFARETMEENEIRVMTTSDLSQLALTAREDLRL